MQISFNIGCHIANHRPECCRGCGGRYKKFNREVMLHLLKDNRLDPENMPCGMLKRQAVEMTKEKKFQQIA